jgi:hypothetical protein
LCVVDCELTLTGMLQECMLCAATHRSLSVGSLRLRGDFLSANSNRKSFSLVCVLVH